MAKSLDDQLDALVKKHDLDSISITRQISGSAQGDRFTCTSVRSRDGHFEVTTIGTAAEQLSHCIATVIAKRSMQPIQLSEVA